MRMRLLTVLHAGGLSIVLLLAGMVPAGAQLAAESIDHAEATATVRTLVTRNAMGEVVAEQPHPESSIPLYSVPAAGDGDREQTGSPLVQLLGMLLKLGAVLVVAYVAMMALKKHYAGAAARPAAVSAEAAPSGRAIQVLESAPLGQGRSVHLVAVGQQVYVVGSAAQQVTLLGEAGADPEVQALLARMRTQGAGTPFQQVLGRLLPAQPAAPQQEAGR